MDIDSLNGEQLKSLAKRSLEEAFCGPPLDVTEAEKKELALTNGVFVTLKVDNELHGCIGRLDHSAPLWRKIPELAKAAAFEDNRFMPLTKEEMPSLSVEITILGDPVPVKSLDEIAIGRDGLIVEKGYCRGLLLPQVAQEYGWDVETFLRHTCLKAGLPPDAWGKGGVKLYKFEGVVFC